MKVSVSILSGDFLHLGEQVAQVQSWGTDWLHLDVMDGMFVPNLTFGIPVIEQLRTACTLPFDVHLMLQEPHCLVESFARAGANSISIHAECDSPIADTLQQIRGLGCKAALAICPDTAVETALPYLPLLDMVLVMSVEPGRGGQRFIPTAISKLERLRRETDARGLTGKVLLQMDGGIGRENAPQLVAAGLDVAVVGSALLNDENPQKMIEEIQRL